MKKFIAFLLKHKIYTVIVLAVLVLGGYFGWQKFFVKKTTVTYQTAKVEKSNLIVSLSGSGQIAASNQIDLMPKVSGDLISLNVTTGQEVKKGDVIARIDSAAAQKTVRDARMSLESAQLSLTKLKQSADSLTLLQAQNNLAKAKEDKETAEEDLLKSYDDGFNTVASTFLDLPGIMQGLDDILYGNNVSSSGQYNIDAYADLIKNYNEKVLQYRDDAASKYKTARAAYDQSFAEYKTVTRSSDQQTIETLINNTYETTKTIAEAVKSANNLIDFVEDQLQQRNFDSPSATATHQSSLDSYTSKTSSSLVDLLSTKQSISSAKTTIINDERSIEEKTQSLADVEAGTDPLDIKAQELSVQQKQNSLNDALENLADYTVKAPFDGVIAKTNVEKGDSVSASTAIATLITKQQVATISLNEVDAAKVKVGQAATITFDAIDDLDITGEVASVDTLGTVSSGVVSYDVKIVFDVQDSRIKSGMTVNATIIVSSKPDVLLIKSSAVKTQNGASYVEVLQNSTAQKKTVTVGESNDTMTEITSGLSEGEEVITQIISASSSSSSKTSSSSSSSSSKTSSKNSFGGGGMMPGM
jgi:RND family efflux transporter MFP subunit